MTRVRPLELGVLAFLIFVLVRAGSSVFFAWRELAGLRTVSVFLALALVGAIDLARQFRWLEWPAARAAIGARHRRFSLLAFAPVVLVAALVFSGDEFRSQLLTARTAQAVPWLTSLFLRVVGAGLPSIVIWLLIGLELKRAEVFVPRRFIVETTRALGTTLREWSPLLFILSAYAWMDAVVSKTPVRDFDATMQAADIALFGADPLSLLEPLINQPLSEWLAFSYSFYAVLFPLVLGAVFLHGGIKAFRTCAFLLGGSLLVAYVSYTLVPVKGPTLTRTFDVSLDLYLLASVKEAMMDVTRITYDCFPSMHTCCSVLLSVCAFMFARRLFWWTLPMVVSIPFACVYLRYHYVVDVLAGLVLAAVMVVVTRRLKPIIDAA